jgi:nucleoid-associated protein YgaU
VTRKRKLLTAGFILVMGFILAWPFRKSDDTMVDVRMPSEKPVEVLRASNGDPIASSTPQSVNHPAAPQQVVAHTASTGEQTNNPKPANGLASFDLANHPALADHDSDAADATLPTPETSGSETRPAYATVTDSAPTNSQPAWRPELIHIVANGDTLEKLAKRYLNDAGRALEIFDLNRDQLSNPHLLPIGVELRVPADPDRILD